MPVLGGGALYAAPANEGPRQAIQAAYDASNTAAEHKEAAGTLAHFLPDAVSIDTKGRSTPIQEQQRVVTRLFAAAKSVTAHTEILQFTQSGPDQATAKVHEHTAITLVNPQNRQPAQFVVDDTALDLWVKSARGWRQKSSKDLTYSATLNGQPLPSSG